MTYEIEVPCLGKYLEKVKILIKNFDNFELERILWSKNDHIDSLAKSVR